MLDVQMKKFFLIGYLRMWNYVSFFIPRHLYFCTLHNFNVLDGLGWSEASKEILRNIYELQLDACQIKLRFTFKKNHRDEMFTQEVESKKSTKQKSFTFFLLTLDDFEAEWQQFLCPMDFPQCHYNWCISGENREVSLYILSYL